jgi:hypothetical protein
MSALVVAWLALVPRLLGVLAQNEDRRCTWDTYGFRRAPIHQCTIDGTRVTNPPDTDWPPVGIEDRRVLLLLLIRTGNPSGTVRTILAEEEECSSSSSFRVVEQERDRSFCAIFFLCDVREKKNTKWRVPDLLATSSQSRTRSSWERPCFANLAKRTTTRNYA